MGYLRYFWKRCIKLSITSVPVLGYVNHVTGNLIKICHGFLIFIPTLCITRVSDYIVSIHVYSISSIPGDVSATQDAIGSGHHLLRNRLRR